jgi:hypothetical protein
LGYRIGKNSGVWTGCGLRGLIDSGGLLTGRFLFLTVGILGNYILPKEEDVPPRLAGFPTPAGDYSGDSGASG